MCSSVLPYTSITIRARTHQTSGVQYADSHFEFYKTKLKIKNALNPSRPHDVLKYCSINCANDAKRTKIDHVCTNCGTTIKRTLMIINRTPNHFCSSSCSAKYSNTHKKYGTRRSKLEMYIESTLTELYPNLQNTLKNFNWKPKKKLLDGLLETIKYYKRYNYYEKK